MFGVLVGIKVRRISRYKGFEVRMGLVCLKISKGVSVVGLSERERVWGDEIRDVRSGGVSRFYRFFG